MLRALSEFQSPASAISASLRLSGFETWLTRKEKKSEIAETSNAEKWILYLSAFDISAIYLVLFGPSN
jgi:hypothetical protein